MNIEVFEPKQEKDETVKLRLGNDCGGGVTLFAVDKNGEPLPNGRLLKIASNGSLLFYYDVNKDLGFRLTDRGSLL